MRSRFVCELDELNGERDATSRDPKATRSSYRLQDIAVPSTRSQSHISPSLLPLAALLARVEDEGPERRGMILHAMG